MEKDKISVIMSFYNEKEEEITKSINSILNQTYKNWELILICDNPSRLETYNLLKKIYKYEKRIKLSINSQNIGLALSMNKAIEIAVGEYIARMDSDDICILNRFEEQINFMKKNNLDLCCSEFLFIDEEDKIFFKEYTKYSSNEIIKLLPYQNTIHHPTVMIKKNIIESVKGYRNFPCAQDYDLWLRLFEKNISMGILNKPLIKYRIRKNSISQSKKLKQINTGWYIRKCFWERKKNGKDSFTIENYNEYLRKQKVFDSNYNKKFKKDQNFKNKIDLYKKNNKSIYYILIMFLFIRSSFYKKYYINIIKNKFYILINYKI